jgi:hypothetical protein
VQTVLKIIGLNSPISALCVSISCYEGVSLLTHELAPGLFCTPATEAIKYILKIQFLGFFMVI